MESLLQGNKEEFKYYYFWAHSIVFLIIDVLYSIMLIYRFIREIRNEYLDLYRIFQYIFLMICFSGDIVHSLQIFIFAEDAEFGIKYDMIASSFFTAFFILNQFCWLTLIVHVNALKLLKATNPSLLQNSNSDEEVRTEKYKSIRKKIRSTEILMVVVIISIISLHLTRQVLCALADVNDKGYFPDNIDSDFKRVAATLMSTKIITFTLLIVASVITYLKLSSLMKESLAYYHQRLKRKLFIICLNNVIYFGMLIIWQINYLVQVFVFEADPTLTSLILYTVFVLILNCSLYFVIYYNINNIQFKECMANIYFGYRILSHFPGASIFLVKSCFNLKSSQSLRIEVEPSITLSSYYTEDEEEDDCDISKGVAMQIVRDWNIHFHSY